MTTPRADFPVLLGLGTAQPEFPMTQDEATALAHEVICRTEAERRLVQTLYRKAGVKERRTALPHQLAYEWGRAAATEAEAAAEAALPATATAEDETTAVAVVTRRGNGPTTRERMQFYNDLAPGLALAAASTALENARLRGDQITHLVTVSCTGFVAPGIDLTLVDLLGLPPTVGRVQIGFMGCHGAVNGLRAAQALAQADPRNHILLVAVELCSLHFCMDWDPARAVGNAVFADGAAALVLAHGSVAAPVDEEFAPLRVAAVGSCFIPNSADAMSWQIGNHGYEMFLSPRVPDLIRAHLRPWFDEWLAAQGYALDDIGCWAVHPGGPRVLTAVEECLGIGPEGVAVSREVLSACGNMSSPTILFILERLRRSGARMPCVALGFGPGLAAEAALFV